MKEKMSHKRIVVVPTKSGAITTNKRIIDSGLISKELFLSIPYTLLDGNQDNR